MKPLIYNLGRLELETVCAEHDQPRFRAGQIWRWLYVQRVTEWAAMRNLPASLRRALAESFLLPEPEPLATQGKPDETRKLLIGLRDGECVEAVMIPAADRRTLCLSSQVGCRFHCAFCASGQGGYQRQLEAGEIVQQVMSACMLWGDRPTHIVYMGVGEPFDNYDAVLTSVRTLNNGDGLGIGARRITISTCGVVPGIERLAEESIQVELSVSLHASSDAVRTALMPVNKTWPIDTLLAACRAYAERTGRIITFEYTLIRDVNDSEADAHALARRLANLPCRVNLIPLSDVPEFEGKPSSPAAADLFIRALAEQHINATLRASKGSGLEAACGQLRAKHR
ncbi:MAG: 23S rRNA (adenine(2503)-C(2))-methyltransferase RlmN [Kiritimatiellia bacterium]|jgi:23S rRNA (adenine2503-C2)-methyltransferase|nr:23S rRNA (adenine(2503)-C(2))-methyltransferase RlmN [Kiritimatiellia bacterium]MDP6631717.1 23S rRNA (adenine(2503)-C(2))-methyltransferase RlmN [Kiritimatiellia bacterium]MDP6810531.1 23S rRNA (adenine(2503)-C(2))-methyltransferase RlmN [Kiritimatiellia bacterium]MDP7024953.1 23S rRNA (adenine(2503)-C(2))-methyltransferase RlmN [Kiritimatiellia bacterium]